MLTFIYISVPGIIFLFFFINNTKYYHFNLSYFIFSKHIFLILDYKEGLAQVRLAREK